MPNIEVHVDHVRGIVAVSWPSKPGYWFYDEHHSHVEQRWTLPAGMTRLVDDEEAGDALAAAANDSGQLPRVRAPRRHLAKVEGA